MDLLPQQQLVVEHARKKNSRAAVLTSRRSGKSYVAISILLYKCLSIINAECLFIGLTYKSVLKSGWKTAIHLLNKYKIKYKANKTNLTIELYNGSMLYFGSCQHKSDADMYLGSPYNCVCIDEAGSFEAEVLDYLVDEVLDPALSECYGNIIMLGTPREIDCGRFYRATTIGSAGWAHFSWSTLDNIHIAEAWKAKLNQLERENPGIDIWSIPKVQREYLGKWAREDSEYVYRLEPQSLIKEYVAYKPTYILGIDVGFRDASAFVLGAWNKHSKIYYIIESSKKSGMLYDDIANKIKYYRNKYSLENIVIDASGGSKVIQESLAKYFGAAVNPAEKTEKHNHIEMFNTEIKLGNIKIIEENNKDLISEMKTLPWDHISSGKWQEKPGMDNHLCFVSGTIVDTIKGPQLIENIRCGDMVKTRAGYNMVIESGSNGLKDTVSVVINNKYRLTGTQDHPVFTNNRGKVNLINIKHGDTLWVNMEHQYTVNGTVKNIEDIQRQLIEALDYTSIEQKMVAESAISTEKYMNSIMEKFLTIFTYITKMKTQQIIAQTILSYFSLANILGNTLIVRLWNWLERTLSWQLPRLQSGIEVNKESIGTQNMEKLQLLNYMLKRSALIASCAEKNLKQLNISVEKFVQTNVIPNKEEILELMMNPEHVASVVMDLEPINIANKSIALMDVRTISVEPAGIQEVYNLTVENNHEYFANNILVSNCDAMLYGWRYAYNYLEKPAYIINEEDEMWNKIEQKVMRQKQRRR